MPRSRSRSLESMIKAAGGRGIAEDVRLLEQAIDEGRFAMIDVGDDGDVAKSLQRQHADRGFMSQ